MDKKMDTKTFVGVADAHGIESFSEKNDCTSFERQCRIMRAGANRQRHAVYFEADLDKMGEQVIQEYLDVGDCALALEWLKRLSLELRSLPGMENSWKLIPNVDLDPYA